MTDQTAKLDWRDGVPIATAFDDPYYSLDDGLAETRHVFVDGNNLHARFGNDVHIAELGFGAGLNFLVTWAAWAEAGKQAPLYFTSFEAFPMAANDMTQALSNFPQLDTYADAFLAAWSPDQPLVSFADGLTLDVIIGDARQTLPRWKGLADVWYLDGFSPAKNPQLWQPDLLHAVGAHTKSGGTAATYSAAGHVRRALEDAGFSVERTRGFGRKRHMTKARMSHGQ